MVNIIWIENWLWELCWSLSFTEYYLNLVSSNQFLRSKQQISHLRLYIWITILYSCKIRNKWPLARWWDCLSSHWWSRLFKFCHGKSSKMFLSVPISSSFYSGLPANSWSFITKPNWLCLKLKLSCCLQQNSDHWIKHKNDYIYDKSIFGLKFDSKRWYSFCKL